MLLRSALFFLTSAAFGLAATPPPTVPAEPARREKWPAELHVSGRDLLTPEGGKVWLQGVNAGGMETLPNDRQPLTSVLVAIEGWKSNAVRLPIKEEFWYGHHPSQKDGGAAYRERVDQAIMLAANRGAYLVLDLHRFGAIRPEHVAFWQDAAARYRNHPAVLFDVFNEPHDISWEVWRNGGFVGARQTKADEDAFLSADETAKAKRDGFESPGMQRTVDAIRATGAKNIIVAGGLAWSGDLSGVATGYALDDPLGHGIVYGWHIYNWHRDWRGRLRDVPDRFPILVGEVGADVKKMPFVPAAEQEDPYTWVPDMLGFIQAHRLNWTAWCLHPRATPVLITDWNYTPSPFWGEFAKAALAGKQFPLTKER